MKSERGRRSQWLAGTVLAAAMVISLPGRGFAHAETPNRPDPWKQEPFWLWQCEGLGVKLGPSWATLGGRNVGAVQPLWSGGVALYATYRFNKQARLQIEALYTRKGGTLGESTATGTSLELDYLEVPVLLQGVIYQPDKTLLLFSIGLAPSFRLAASAATDGESWDAGDVISSRDIDLHLGVTVEHKLSRGRLVADLRYVVGYHTLDDDGSTWQADVRTRTVLVLLGYSFK